jgi:hypothetical protein
VQDFAKSSSIAIAIFMFVFQSPILLSCTRYSVALLHT